MNAQKKQTSGIFFYFEVVMLIPLTWLLAGNTRKVLDIYALHPESYAFTKAELLENVHRKYGDRATYRFSYQGQTIEGRNQSTWWSSVGDSVRIYFEKANVYNNGICSQLIALTTGQCLFFIALVAFVSFKRIRHARTS